MGGDDTAGEDDGTQKFQHCCHAIKEQQKQLSFNEMNFICQVRAEWTAAPISFLPG